MNRILKIVAFFLVVFVSLQASAQLPDGVSATASFIDIIKLNYIEENSIAFDVNTVKEMARIPVRVHVVKNKKGVADVGASDIVNGIDIANAYFKNIGVQYFIDSVNYVNDYNYSFVSSDKNRIEALVKYQAKNKINLFLVDSVYVDNRKCLGLTYFPDVVDTNSIFLDKKYVGGVSLSTMLGHFMGLLSTHETLGGNELVNEKNCSFSGDFICDTYADPDLYNQVADTCYYTGAATDQQGKYFVPTVANIMSNSLPGCKCSFTPLQYRRMYYYFRKYRQYLKY